MTGENVDPAKPNEGLRLELDIHDAATGRVALPDGNLPTASFPIGPNASFSGIDFHDPSNIVELPLAHISDLTLMVTSEPGPPPTPPGPVDVPEPRAPLAAFGIALLTTLWLRRRKSSSSP